jgi:hypothetical protein
MCIACKEFCHAGHQTMVANDGTPIFGVCDCGNGYFARRDKTGILNSKNPYFDSKNGYFEYRFEEEIKKKIIPSKQECFCRKDYP